MSGVHDDLATLLKAALARSASFKRQNEIVEAHKRVEAEIARLKRHPDAWSQEAFDQQKARAEAAEAQALDLARLSEEQLARALAAEDEVARLRDGLRLRNELIAKTIYKPPGWTGPDVWWADEARALLAEDGAAHDPFKGSGIEPHHRKDFHKAEDGAV